MIAGLRSQTTGESNDDARYFIKRRAHTKNKENTEVIELACERRTTAEIKQKPFDRAPFDDCLVRPWF